MRAQKKQPKAPKQLLRKPLKMQWTLPKAKLTPWVMLLQKLPKLLAKLLKKLATLLVTLLTPLQMLPRKLQQALLTLLPTLPRKLSNKLLAID